MRIPGFRKGKVPPPVVIRRLGREAVLDEALRKALGSWYVDAIDEAGIAPIGEPDLDVGDLPDEGQPLAFSIEIGVRPKAKLGEYKGLEVGRREPEVDDALIDSELEALRDRFATLETVERPRRVRRPRRRRLHRQRRRRAVRGRRGPRSAARARLRPADPGLRGAADRRRGRRQARRRGHVPRRLSGRPRRARPPCSRSRSRGQGQAAARARRRVRRRRGRVRHARRAARGHRQAAQARPRSSAIEREFEQAVLDAAADEAEVELPDKLVHARAHELLEQTLSSLARARHLQGGLPADRRQGRGGARPRGRARGRGRRCAARPCWRRSCEAEQIEPTDEQVLEALGPAAEREGTDPEELLERLRKNGRLERVRDGRRHPPGARAARRARPSRSASSRPRRARSCGRPGKRASGEGSGSGQLWTPGS